MEEDQASLEAGECHQREDFKEEALGEAASKEEEAIKDEEDGVDVVAFNCVQYAH